MFRLARFLPRASPHPSSSSSSSSSLKGLHRRLPPRSCSFAIRFAAFSTDLEQEKHPKPRKSTSQTSTVKYLASYLWRDDPGNRARVVVSLGLLVGAKLVNVQVPFLFKDAVDALSLTTVSSSSSSLGDVSMIPLAALLGYGIARSTSSMFNELRTAIFARVAHNSIRRVALDAFKHLHELDLTFHLNRDTGGLSRAIDRGTRAIDFILRALVFNVVPTIFEIGLVATILGVKCGQEFTAVTAATLLSYCVYTVGITNWRTQFRRDMNRLDGESNSKAIDSLINYETVKYFNNEALEAQRYGRCVEGYQHAALKTSISLSALNFGQNIIFSAGLTCMMILAAQKIATGELSVGDMVMVNGLLFQLSVPLNFVGSVYRDVRQALIDLEHMMALKSVDSSIVDDENDPELHCDSGELVFDNVSFSYTDERGDHQILKNLSFTVPAGKSAAIVGTSGSGKSTILRLLYRFYDPTEGQVRVDGQDIRTRRLSSVRRHIGVVPQDTVLFNDTLAYNIAYGAPGGDVPREEVHRAAQEAKIHDSIMEMPRQYDTVVGERGLKISGGEKQRVAIARMLLKKPKIVFCDEATSALDSNTEADILTSLKRLAAGHTSVFVAHRLSTVVDVDQVLVLHKGRIVERGSHAQLLRQRDSLYRKMWLMQQHEHKLSKE